MIRAAVVTTLLLLAPLADAALPTWVTAAAEAASVTPAKGVKAEVLLDATRIEVTDGGHIEIRRRRVLKILTPAGRDLGYASVFFDDETKLRRFRAWSIDSTGRNFEVRERDAVETQPLDFELYSDLRMKAVRIPAAEPGSIVAFEYEQRQRPHVLQATWRFQEAIPVRVATFELVLPAAWSHEALWTRFKPTAPTEQGTLRAWELRDLPPIRVEPGMPPLGTLAGRMTVNFVPPHPHLASRTQRSWNDIAGWFSGLAAARSASTPAIDEKVRSLAPEGASPVAVRALASFAQRDVRYVAIEIGIGGYQPHAAAQVFSNRYGDCKDKANLLRTMLRGLGIPSYFVLVHTTRGMIDPAVPTIGAFDHVILAIRSDEVTPATVEHPRLGKLLLFDPTSTTTAFGELPAALQESYGLLIAEDGGELIGIPAHRPETNQLRRTARLRLDSAGALSGEVEEVRTGRVAADMRASLSALTTSDRIRFIESMLAAHLSNHSTRNVRIDQLENTNQDLVIRYELVASQYAKRLDDMLLIRPRVMGAKAESVLDLSERVNGYVTEGPSLHIDDIEIEILPSLTLDELPPAVELTTPFLTYSSSTTFSERVLRYQRRYSVGSYFIPHDMLAEMNRSFLKISADERASAVLR